MENNYTITLTTSAKNWVEKFTPAYEFQDFKGWIFPAEMVSYKLEKICRGTNARLVVSIDGEVNMVMNDLDKHIRSAKKAFKELLKIKFIFFNENHTATFDDVPEADYMSFDAKKAEKIDEPLWKSVSYSEEVNE